MRAVADLPNEILSNCFEQCVLSFEQNRPSIARQTLSTVSTKLINLDLIIILKSFIISH